MEHADSDPAAENSVVRVLCRQVAANKSYRIVEKMCHKTRLRAQQGDARAGLRAQVVEVGGLDAVVGACETSLGCVSAYCKTFGLQWVMSISK